MAGKNAAKTRGRKPGTPSSTATAATAATFTPTPTATSTPGAVKEALQTVFEDIGGTGWLKTWAENNEAEFFKSWIKLLPQEIKADVTVKTDLVDIINQGRVRVTKPE